MENTQTDLLTESVLGLNNKRRKELLPLWIKIFCWLFLIFGVLAIVALIFGILGYKFDLELYGIGINDPVSPIGLALTIIFLFKGYTAYSLLKEKDNAITLGMVDAIAGIAICCLVMLYQYVNQKNGAVFSFRLELIALIPYLLKMQKIKAVWENSIEA